MAPRRRVYGMALLAFRVAVRISPATPEDLPEIGSSAGFLFAMAFNQVIGDVIVTGTSNWVRVRQQPHHNRLPCLILAATAENTGLLFELAADEYTHVAVGPETTLGPDDLSDHDRDVVEYRLEVDRLANPGKARLADARGIGNDRLRAGD